ncbi:MAG: hypothetical protein IKR73_00120, partial [Oscillospiraceae bacterium]|nr:hypothetical protein [Oscillospiraceae bacterium]
IVANKNDALVPAGDISFGCTKDKVIGAYYSDPEEDTPDDLKEAGGRIIYGRKDYEVFESISLGSNMDAEEDMSGRYMFAYESPGSGNSSVAYYVLDIDKKFKMSIYMLMYTFSDDEGLETITVMDMSGEDLQSLSDLASGEEDTADDANDTDNDDADDKE